MKMYSFYIVFAIFSFKISALRFEKVLKQRVSTDIQGVPKKRPSRLFKKDWIIFSKLFLNYKISCISTSFKNWTSTWL